MKRQAKSGWLRATFLSGVLVVVAGSTGCQVDYAGQTLPSAYYLTDDVQYFPPGPEFKLSREAAAMKAYKAELELERGR